MRKAEDYLNYFIPFEENSHTYFERETAIKAIKQAQIEAIEETVNACAEAANLSVRPIPRYNMGSPDYEYIVNKQSILSVADKIKAKL